MKAIVFISAVQNPEEPLSCPGGRLQPIPDNTIINDFDLIAVEKAVQLKESGDLDEVILFCMAGDKSLLQKPLAIGADRAVFVQIENEMLTPEIVVNTALSAIPAEPDTIWMLGKTGVNFESHQTAQRLAAALNIDCLCSAFRMERSGADWRIACEDDFGIPTYRIQVPFVVTTDLRLAEPRFPSLPNLIKAKRKPIQEISMPQTSSIPGIIVPAAEKRRACTFITPDEFISKYCKSPC